MQFEQAHHHREDETGRQRGFPMMGGEEEIGDPG